MFPLFIFAATGTIDTTNKWAWSESAGWIDFGTTGGNVQVTDSTLSGYAYGENIGWISLHCSNTSSCVDNNYGVLNNNEGTLSGYAWSETVGWIHFAPSSGGVTINSSGVFSGTAYGENIGWISFSTDHPVTTDWRPVSSQVTTPTQSGGNGAPVSGPLSLGYVSVNTPTPTLPVSSYTTPLVPEPTILQKFTFTKNYTSGNQGSDIKRLQQFLNANGFTVATKGAGSPGSETTYFGSLTRLALIHFQKAHKIYPSVGYFGPLTRAYINNNY